MLSRKMLKSKDPNNAFWSIFWSKSDRFCLFLGDPEQGRGAAGAPLDPPLALVKKKNFIFYITFPQLRVLLFH